MAIDIAESKSVVKKFIAKKKPPFPILLDVDGKVAATYGVRSHPAHFLVNGIGELVGSRIGAIDWTRDQNRDLIRHLTEMNP